ncbi:ParB/RepB/Spo0J family partition protein [Microvirga puerhi]|uniref:ParB/RepB/Spo0J family partition protein n=1 Tax=Microvirga puerhi TaxID=2876078 RepID=A0ABS7VTJ2_9HYPH|nr:ParB/RepB/Spo0J family partition protein [Microvirga puerhi]MBZ6078888.1 ParB/RepB/Spo0J family partition protein [Microvirga puerhi]
MTITTIALSKLVPSKENVRRYNSEAGIEGLAADISAHGLIHNLSVKPGATGKFEVLAGGRRLRALKHLEKTGGTIRGEKVTKDYLVPVMEGLAEGVSATELSLSENFQRSAMHPADEIEAFGKLHREDGLSPEEIAARYGISHMTVRRRLALAGLSPRLLQELREDKMSLEQAQALAISADQARQEAAWFEVTASWQRQAYTLKNRMTEEHLSPSDKIAKFIRDEYLAAGGPVERDLFATVEQAYLVDRDLASRLVAEKLEGAAQTVAAEGWSWVKAEPELEFYLLNDFDRIRGKPSPLSKEDKANLKELNVQAETLEKELEDREIYGLDEDDEDLSEEELALVKSLIDVRRKIDAIENRPEIFSKKDLARAGAFISINHEGRLRIERGLIQGEEKAPGVSSSKVHTSEQTRSAEPESLTLSAALTEDLTAQRSAALAVELSKRPDAALMVLVYTLALQHFYSSTYSSSRPDSAIQIRRERLPQVSSEVSESLAIVSLSQIEADWKVQLPASSHDLWDWCRAASQETLNQLMAALVGLSLNATQQSHERRGKRHENADRIAEAIDFDMTKHWQPDSAFFKRTSKAYMAETILSAAGSDFAKVAKNVAKLSKAEAVSATVDAVAGRGWLPAELRTQEPAPVIEDEADDLDDELSEEDLDEAA